MKPFICRLVIPAILFIPVSVLAQSLNQQVIPAKIQEVTVFINGAEITDSERVPVKKGRSTLIFDGVSPFINTKSVQVSAENVELLSVSTEDAIAATDAKIKVIQDSIDILTDKIELIHNEVDALQFEKKMLAENQRLGGNQNGVTLVELSKAADFFRERTLKINNALTTFNNKIKTFDQSLKALHARYKIINDKVNTARKQIIVVVSSDKDLLVNFKIRYLVNEAGWIASYDLVAPDINKPVTLKYKAQVYNNTAIDWTDVKLTLSTSDPSLAASRPYLTTWTLNYTSMANEGLLENKALQYNNDLSDSAVEYDDIAVAELSTSFDIAQRHSVLANGEFHRLDLINESLNATFEYVAVPKVDLSAFLIAKVTGWEKLNLISGTANVYFGNTYIGESRIDTQLMSDTLELSLGRDNQILVGRAKLEDKASANFIGAKREESFIYEIQIKNNRKTPITIKIQDQIPISQESDIVVETSNLSGASLDKLSGRLQWFKTIPASENVKYTVAFSVRHPKSKYVNIRKQRVVRSPRYQH
jgi:uncharacterized protein (TIGR02231 family)